MGVNISISISQMTQSAANNSSNIKVDVYAKWDNGTFNRTGNCTGTLTIDGTSYSYKGLRFNPTQTTNGSEIIMSKTLDVKHDSEGKKTVSCSATFVSGVSSGTVNASASKTLTPIARKSTLQVIGNVLDSPMYLMVDRKLASYTHTISYSCGTMSAQIVRQSSEVSIQWTPPRELASQAPAATSVSVTFTITTYNGNTSLGSNTVTANFSIPATWSAPVLLPSVTDEMGYLQQFGGYVQGKSKVRVSLDTYGSYGAWLTSTKVVFDGSTYTTTSFVTEPIKGSGTLPLQIEVVDSRGRTTRQTVNLTVLAYEPPKITSLTTARCNQDGSLNSGGSYLLATFSATVTPLNNRNTATYYVGYKKATEETHTAVEVTNLANRYTVSGGTCVVPAETSYSYTIICTVADAFGTTTVVTTGASANKVWSMLKNAGKVVGMAFGKVAEFSGVLEIGWQALFSGGILHPVLPDRTNLNTVLSTTTHMLPSANTYTNAPESGFGAFLENVGQKNTSLIQRYSVFDRANPRVYERVYYSSTGWGDWKCIRGDFVVEQGVFSGWTYRKWNSGVAECWKILEFSTTINTAFGSMYCGNATDRQSYPFAFVEKPVETVTLQSGSTQAILYCEASGYGVNGTSASARYNVFRPGAITTSQTFYLSFHVIGKWK